MKSLACFERNEIEKMVDRVKTQIDKIYDVLEEMEEKDDYFAEKKAKVIRERLQNIKREVITLHN